MNCIINGFPCAGKRTGADKFIFFESNSRKNVRHKAKTNRFVRVAVSGCVLCAALTVGVLVSGSSPKAQGALVRNEGNNAVETAVSHSAADFEVVTAKITVDSSTAVNSALDDVVAVGKMDASGGEDIASEQAIKGASFASYTVSAPVTVPVNGRLTSPFGYRTNPVSGKYGFHTGIDLAAPEGTAVASAYGGRVTNSGESDVWGKFVLLEHSDGFETYYCHLSEIYAPEGTVLRKGETLGLVGSTGWSTGPHLHFEVRIDGVRVDPEPLIKSNEN